MQLSETDIDRFIFLYKTTFGQDISPQEAQEQGLKLTRLMRLIYQPISKSDLKNLNHN